MAHVTAQRYEQEVWIEFTFFMSSNVAYLTVGIRSGARIAAMSFGVFASPPGNFDTPYPTRPATAVTTRPKVYLSVPVVGKGGFEGSGVALLGLVL